MAGGPVDRMDAWQLPKTIPKEVHHKFLAKRVTPPRLPGVGIETLGPLITTSDVAEYTHKSLATIRKQCRSGRIRAVKESGRWVIDRDSALKEVIKWKSFTARQT